MSSSTSFLAPVSLWKDQNCTWKQTSLPALLVSVVSTCPKGLDTRPFSEYCLDIILSIWMSGQAVKGWNMSWQWKKRGRAGGQSSLAMRKDYRWLHKAASDLLTFYRLVAPQSPSGFCGPSPLSFCSPRQSLRNRCLPNLSGFNSQDTIPSPEKSYWYVDILNPLKLDL